MSFPSVRALNRRATVLLAVTALAGGGAVALATPSQAEVLSAGRYVPVSPVRIVDSRSTGGTPIGANQTRVLDLGTKVDDRTSAVVLNLTAVNSTTASYLTMWPANNPRPIASNLQSAPGEVRAVSVTVPVDNVDGRHLVNLYNYSGRTDYVVDLFGYYTQTFNSALQPASFYPATTPERVLDTRQAGTGGQLRNGDVRTITASATIGDDAKTGVRAVAVNITAVDPRGQGYLTAWSGEGPAPSASNVNFAAGRNAANFAVVPILCASDDCSRVVFSLRNLSLGTDVVVDVLGFYAAPFQGGGGFWVTSNPYRIVDTRLPQGFGPLPTRGVGTASVGEIDEQPVIAVNATVTAIRPTINTYLTTFPAGVAVPTASTVNVLRGQVLSNATQVRTAGDTSAISVFNYAGTTNLVVDVNGGFVDDSRD